MAAHRMERRKNRWFLWEIGGESDEEGHANPILEGIWTYTSCCCLVTKSRPNLCDRMDIKLLCPSLSPGVCSDSCPLSRWCHPTISSSVVPFSSCPQSFPASGSFPVSQVYIHILQIAVWLQCDTRLLEVVVTEGGVGGILTAWNRGMAVGAGRHDWIQETLRRSNLSALVLTGWCAGEGQGEVMARAPTWAIDTIHRACPVVGGSGRRREDLAATERWLEELVKFPSSPAAMRAGSPIQEWSWHCCGNPDGGWSPWNVGRSSTEEDGQGGSLWDHLGCSASTAAVCTLPSPNTHLIVTTCLISLSPQNLPPPKMVLFPSSLYASPLQNRSLRRAGTLSLLLTAVLPLSGQHLLIPVNGPSTGLTGCRWQTH